jgi:hypothetical protein
VIHFDSLSPKQKPSVIPAMTRFGPFDAGRRHPAIAPDAKTAKRSLGRLSAIRVH